MKVIVPIVLSLALLTASRTAYSAEAGFYSFGEKWDRARATGQSKETAIEDGFKTGLLAKETHSPILGIPAPQALNRTLAEIIQTGATVEIEQNQTLFLSTNGSATKFVTTDEGIALVETTSDPQLLNIVGIGIGRTFVHVWDSQGRRTFELRVLSPRFVPTASQIRQKEALEQSSSFRLGYENSRSSFYQAEKYHELNRQSSDFQQKFTMDGDTPYGNISSYALMQQDQNRKVLVTDALMEVKDGKVGPFKNFNAGVGDNEIVPNLLVFPRARVRGVEVDHKDAKDRVKWSTFYGREQTSIIGAIRPGLSGETTEHSFLGGGTVDLKFNEDSSLKTGYYSGFGPDREDELNRHGLGTKGSFKVGKNLTLVPETDYDNESFANKHAMVAKFEKLRIKTEFRDMAKKFHTLLGSPSHQGELGWLVDFSADPNAKLNVSGQFDVFKDRLVPNPGDMEALNFHTDLTFRVIPTDRSSLTFNFRDLDDGGRLGPSKQRSFSSQYNQVVEWFGHKYAFTSRHQIRNSRSIDGPVSDYTVNQFALGLQTELMWGINFSVSQEWNQLDEYNADSTTYPSALVMMMDYSHRLGDTPFYTDINLRLRDEENTESQNSFMTGEDSAEISGGLYYREYEHMELFLTGTMEFFEPEGPRSTAARVENNIYAGMRYLFDTGIRWQGVGSFSGLVFKDLNSDGLRQPDEPGLPGQTVVSGDGKEAVTDESGHYAINSVAGKMAVLTLDSTKIPYGYTATGPMRREIPIVQNETVEADFGLVPRSEFTGIIFNDLNGNGKYDPTDVGVKKVRVRLEDGETARSNNIGVYSFPKIVAGEHTALLDLSTLPQGYLPQDVPKKSFTVFEGLRFEMNFPLRAVRVVSGRVFVDRNGNRTFDGGEKGLANVEVVLGRESVRTDADGWYLFDRLNKGVYPLTVSPGDLPAGMSAPEPDTITLQDDPITISERNIAVSGS